MSNRLSGLNPLSYLGVEAFTPPALVTLNRAPTPNDKYNFNLGTLWLVTPNPIEIWMLVSLVGGTALWVQLYPLSGASSFPTDAGTATPLAGVLNIFGDTRVTTSGAGNTVTIHLSGSVASSYVCNVGTAVPLAGVLNVLGTGAISTGGAGNTITISLSGSVGTSYVTNVGTAVPVAGVLNVLGGTNINTAGAGNTVTINLDNSVTLSGSLTITSLGAGVVQTTAGGLFFSNKGTDGQVLISATAGVPMWANITSLGGTITITNGANTINLETAGGGGGSTTSFFAYLSATTGNVTGDGTPYTVVYDTLVYNTLAGYNTANGIFTAPSTGIYRFNSQVVFQSSTSLDTLALVATSATVQGTSLPATVVGAQGVYLYITTLVSMTAGDTAQIVATSSGGGFVTSIFSFGAGSVYITYLSGQKIA